MAWRSSGTNNEEMVDNLKKFNVISRDEIEQAFRSVDRRYFVPSSLEDSAHLDQPLKEGHVHISAPHIYGSALEALELHPNSCTSFLNIGSGTGYLSCIVAEILGPKSLNFGIEIHKEVVNHSKACIERWLRSNKNGASSPEQQFAHLQIVHGNALHIEATKGECLVGFDRIYIGAAVDRAELPKITKLLSPGGILVGPVEDELVKIVRIGPMPQIDEANDTSGRKRLHEESSSGSDDSSQSSEVSNENYEFSHQVLSGVRFAPLLALPVVETILPARLWSPTLQKFYPKSFQKASMHLLLCSNSDYVQPLPQPKAQNERVNLASMLPRVIWLEILSYTHRKWFETEKSETEYLKKRILEEQTKAAAAQQARIDAENRCRLLERERDLYRLLARRWQSRIQVMIQQQGQGSGSGASPVSGAQGLTAGGANAILPGMISGEERAAIYGLGAMLQQAVDDRTEEENEGGILFPAQDSAMEDANDVAAADEDHEPSGEGSEDQQLIQFLDNQGDSEQGDEYEFNQLDGGGSAVAAAAGNGMDEDVGESESVVMEESGAPNAEHVDGLGLSAKTSRMLIALQPRTVSLGHDDDL